MQGIGLAVIFALLSFLFSLVSASLPLSFCEPAWASDGKYFSKVVRVMLRVPATRLLIRLSSCTCQTDVLLFFHCSVLHRLGTQMSSSAKPSGGPGAAASLHGAEWSACAWPFLDAVSGRCWYAMVSVHIVPQSSRVPSVHIWAEPEWWKKRHGGFLNARCSDSGDGCERRKKSMARGCIVPRKACMPERRIRLSEASR